MKNKKKIILPIVVVVLLFFGIHSLYEHWKYIETDNAQVEAPTVILVAKISGFIKEVNVTEGQSVKKGDVLIVIDNRDYQSIYESLKSELLSLEARRNDSEKTYRRMKTLFAQSVISSQQMDTATANYHEIKARYDSASARLMQAQLNLESTIIKAPANGIIAKKSAEIGQLASPGAPLVGFISSEQRWIMANFKETEIAKIKKGSAVDISIDALSNLNLIGEVESISSATGATFTLLPPDNATGNFTKVVQRIPVKIKFSNLLSRDFENIQAGLSAQVKVHIR